MVALGLAVGKGSTSVDDWFHQYGRGPAKWLLLFTDPRVLAILLAGALAVSVYQRRWRLAVVALMSTALFGGAALAAVPLGTLVDAEGYRSLWLAAALASGVGVLVTLGLEPRSMREPVLE